MSTKCYIGYKSTEDGKIYYSYIHCDGYPEGIGKDLVADYMDYDAIKQVVDKGDKPYLDDDPYSDGSPVRSLDTIEDVSKILSSSICYFYLYIDGKYQYITNGDRKWATLSRNVHLVDTKKV